MTSDGSIDFAVGQIVADKYRVVRELGRGGMGVVYEVEHLHIPGQRLALKILHPTFSRDAHRRKAFIREVQVSLRLVHPNIVTIRDCSATEELTFYTMDYVDGRALDDVLAKDGPPTVERALDWMKQALLALATAHRERIIHRDIKPANILLTQSSGHEVIKVLDFGIAKVLEQQATTGGVTLSGDGIVGTPQYLSPEQGQGKKSIDHRSDLYSLGVVLFELLTGRLPFQSESFTGFIFQHSFEEAPAFSTVAPGRKIPAAIEQIVRRALSKDPAQRFQSADEMIVAIQAALGGAATGVFTGARGGPGAVGPGAATGIQTAAGASLAPGAGSVDWSAELVGQTIEKYRITRMLGRGGFGVVCEAQHALLGRKVALKLLRPELGKESGFTERFRREAQITASLQHPNLITIHDYGEVPGACFIIMEFIEGETFGDLLRRRRSLSPRETWDLIRPALEAIAVAHGQGIVHRDLKPANIMITRDGRVKVLDFGIAKIVSGGGGGAQLTQAGAIVGSAHYLSPEQVLGAPVDPRADLYAIGCILFDMLTGRVPFLKDSTVDFFKAHVQEAPPKLRDVAPEAGISEELERIVDRLLAKEPEGRFASVQELLPALEAACRGAAMAYRGAPASPTGETLDYAAPPRAHGQRTDAATIARADAGVTGYAPPRAAPPLPPTGISPAPYGPRQLGRAARLELLEPPRTSFFLFAGRALRFGRAKPGTGQSQNDLILRLLPCRSQTLDPDNFLRTNEISGQHGELVLQGGQPCVVDQSSRGTWLDGQKLPKGVPHNLGQSFRLGIARVLDLEGRLFPGDGRPVEAVRLRRIGNREEDAYVWVLARAEIGPRGPIDLPVPAGEIRNESDALVAMFPGVASTDAEFPLAGIRCRLAGATPADQVDRTFP